METRRIRWEGEMQGHGDGNGRWIRPEVQHLLNVLLEPDWIAQNPETHLQPHLTGACVAQGSPWTLDAVESLDELFVVRVSWERPYGRLRHLRADAFSLIGSIAESTTFVRQSLTNETIEFRITTGMLDDDGPFAGHGHLILLQIRGELFDTCSMVDELDAKRIAKTGDTENLQRAHRRTL